MESKIALQAIYSQLISHEHKTTIQKQKGISKCELIFFAP